MLAVIIIGKRYGSLGKEKNSITYNEFREIVKSNIPIICLIEQEVMSYKKIYDANKNKKSAFIPPLPGIEIKVISTAHQGDIRLASCVNVSVHANIGKSIPPFFHFTINCR